MVTFTRIWRATKKVFRGENILIVHQDPNTWELQFKKGRWDFMLDNQKRAAAQYIASLLPNEAPHSLLDVGCGNGSLALEVSTRSNITYTGTDISETALATAKRLNPRGIFIQTDAAEPPQDAVYNSIVFSEILYYVPTHKTLRAYAHLLSQNGRIYISMYTSWRNTLLWILLRNYVHIHSFKKITSSDTKQTWWVATCTLRD